MQKNVGLTDRALRAALGIVLLVLPFVSGLALFESQTAVVVSVIVGLVMLGVAATRVCPIYTIFGFKTCRRA